MVSLSNHEAGHAQTRRHALALRRAQGEVYWKKAQVRPFA